VLEFADGLVSLTTVRALAGGPLVQHSLAEIPQLVPGIQMRIVAIYRQDQVLHQLHGDTRIEPGDEVFVLASTRDTRTVLSALRRADRPVKRLMLAGGGRVGLRLAREVHGDYQLKLIEATAKRCEYLVSQLPAEVLVLQGDSTDEELLEDENVGDMDMFLALTSDDEDNIMACLLAKRMGARRVFALINRRAYADLVQGTSIDIALSPSHAVIGELLAYVRRGDVEAVHSLRRGSAGGDRARGCQDLPPCRAAHRADRLARRRADRRHRARAPQPGRQRCAGQRCRAQGHHCPPRHGDPAERPCDRVHAAQAHGARGREAVPGRRHVLLKRHF
jgi:trk system potassium uptake protein